MSANGPFRDFESTSYLSQSLPLGPALVAEPEAGDWTAWETDQAPGVAALFEASATLTTDAEAEADEWSEQAALESPEPLFEIDVGEFEADVDEFEMEVGEFGAPPAATPSSPPIPAANIHWPGATPEQLAFMRAVYEEHFRNSLASWKRGTGRAYVADLPPDNLDVVEARIDNPRRPVPAERETARQARALLEAARADLAAEGRRVRIGVISGYRNAKSQFVIWQGDPKRKTGFPGYYSQAVNGKWKDGVMVKQPFLAKDDLSSAAVATFTRFLRKYVAFPGFSNHQHGRALDFADGGTSLHTFEQGWFYRWLTRNSFENARRFGFQKLEDEAWHFNYVGVAATHHEAFDSWAGEVATTNVPAGKRAVTRVPLLDAHRGGSGRPDPKWHDPDMLLRWNAMQTVPEEVDVVVHLHGYWYPRLNLVPDIESVSGLDLEPPHGADGSGRTRPTLTVLPRGRDTGRRQKLTVMDKAGNEKVVDGPFNVYDFPALLTAQGLEQLVGFALGEFGQQVGTRPGIARVILTAHSGGGRPLNEILAHPERGRCHDPDQLHVFDALYGSAPALTRWAIRHIRRDCAALAAPGAPPAREYMATRGSALRVFHLTTERASKALWREIQPKLVPELAPWYRVEPTSFSHMDIPGAYGWRLLADAAADVPLRPLRARPAARHELELDEEELYESALKGEREPPMNDLAGLGSELWEGELEDLEHAVFEETDAAELEDFEQLAGDEEAEALGEDETWNEETAFVGPSQLQG